MKLHIIVLSLTLAATAAHADLFDKLKKIGEDVSELKEAIEDINGGEDEAASESADNTTVPENSASAAQQGIAANAPSENKPSSKPGNAGSSTGQNMYGWLTGVTYDRRGNPQYPRTRVIVGVSGVTTARSTGIPCNMLYLNRSMPQIEGISVGDLSGKSDQEVSQAFTPHRGKFVRLNNVEVHPQRNQKICVASSVAVVEDSAKADVTYSEVRGFFLDRIVDVTIKAEAGIRLQPPMVPLDTIIRPEEYECTFYRWASADAARAWYEEWKQSGHPRPNVFRMEFVGVRPVDEIGHCEFGTMNIVANEAEKPIATQAASAAPVDTEAQRRFLITLRNDVVYINGIALGMLEQEAKEKLRSLNYETEDFSSRPTVLSDGQNFLKAQFLSGRLGSISIQERPVSNNSKDEIIDSLSAAFGDKIDCKERRSPRGNAIGCTYPKNAPGGHYSLLVSFMPMPGGYGLNITLK